MRRYERFWELLKRDKRIVIKIEGEHMTPAKAEVAAPKIDKPTSTRAFRAGSVIKPLPKAIRAPIIANNNGMV